MKGPFYPEHKATHVHGKKAAVIDGVMKQGTPMIMSFDIRDDTKLLPIWDTLTNEEVRVLMQSVMAPFSLASTGER